MKQLISLREADPFFSCYLSV